MAGELEAVLRRMFEGLDRKDIEAMMSAFADDAQAVDEISRRWLRGGDALEEYLGGLMRIVEDVRSELRDVRETALGDTGIVTCWLEQDYTSRESVTTSPRRLRQCFAAVTTAGDGALPVDPAAGTRGALAGCR